MTAADLRALADRVEAEEPSAELNELVCKVVSGYNFDQPDSPTGVSVWNSWITRPYLTSLDAAMTLCPEGLAVRIAYAPEMSEWSVQLGRWVKVGAVPVMDWFAGSCAPTEAQARTAAALRARAEQESEHG